MKKFFLTSLAFISLVLQASANTPTAQTTPPVASPIETPQKNQEKFIDEILSEYKQGKYQSFLDTADKEYQDAQKKWEHDKTLEERKKLASLVTDFKKEAKIQSDPFVKADQALQEERDRKLIEICLSYPDLSISREVKDMVFFTPSKEEQESLDYLFDLSHKFKGDGKTPLENKLIQIDTEFWLKSLALNIALAQNKIDENTFHKQEVILHLEKLKQMQEACSQDQNNTHLSQVIQIASTVLPKVKAAALTHKHLLALGKEKIQPHNIAEEKMQKVMIEYLQKEDLLVKNTFTN